MGDVSQRYEGGAANTKKNLKTKGRDLKYETSLRINTFLYDELDISMCSMYMAYINSG